MENNSFFVGRHSASSWTSSRQKMHPAKALANSCVGLALLSLIDSSVLGVVCFACLWKCGLCLQALQISLSESMRSCGLDLNCLRIAILSLAHMAQFLAAKVLTTLIGLPCLMMLHCTKSYRPFELFVNANCELWNEVKMNATFKRGSARDPRCSPLSAEMNDASAWRIGVPVVQFVMTLCCNDSSCCAIQNKTSSRHHWEGATCSHHSTQALGLGHCPERPSSLLVKNWASGNWSRALKSAASVHESWMNESCVRMLHACPILGIATWQVFPPRWLTGDRFASRNWVAKCLVHGSNFSPSLTSFWTSLKRCCILASNCCCVFSMHAFPVLLHLTLQTVVGFLHMLL